MRRVTASSDDRFLIVFTKLHVRPNQNICNIWGWGWGWGGGGERNIKIIGKKSGKSRHFVRVGGWTTCGRFLEFHYNNVIMSAMTSQITSSTIVYSTVYSGADQRKHQSYASLAFVREFTGDREFRAQKASNAENVSIWWRQHVSTAIFIVLYTCVWSKR